MRDLDRLCRATLPGPPRPSPTPPAGIVHLGLGNFHRAHQAVYSASAMAHDGDDGWGIHAFGSRSRSVADSMREQDLLYAVLEISPGGATASVPGVHTRVDVAAADPNAVVAAIAAASTRVVTLTVTEQGYTYSPHHGDLDLTNEAVLRDLRRVEAPVTAVAQVTAGLVRRWEAGGAPVTLVSCDNLGHNGATLRRLVTTCATTGPSPYPDEFLTWLDHGTAFPSTMVDRIVPATTDHHRAMAEDLLGLRDAVPVPAEPFSMWVLEDDFAAGRPAWERGGAIFTDDVGSYELLKLRLLNGTHSLLAYLGILAGAATIPASVGLPYVEAAARKLMHDELLPTIEVPSGIDVADYTTSLFSRFSNTALGHRTSQVGTDGSQKLPPRLAQAALTHCRAGDVPQAICLTVAAFLACVAPLDGSASPLARAVEDPMREILARHAAAATSAADLVSSVFEKTDLLPDELTQVAVFRDRVGEFLHILERVGVEAAVREALGEPAPRR